ncbi:unnamed protein product [Moneuplotes crassus]|uniref:FPL domain-containing protein n=1 Tax=Euplotes crassus TaxID=5936 RepID=A0AAD1Y2P6_EUPCR|nr:unnamed protein product [Moneuplotes crassus]
MDPNPNNNSYNSSEEPEQSLTPDEYRTLLEHIEDLEYGELDAAQIDKAVESIRNLSEFLIYGSKEQNSYFELFIERNILGIFSRILEKNCDEINTQLIQTTSILIQNIQKEQDSIYLLSHPFLNNLISHNFNLSEHGEIVDYLISFLKMLALRIDKNNVHFFYNIRFKNFPLYGTAVKLYNHSELMVRTAARTIALTLFRIGSQNIINAVLSLPHANYFPHLACELRDRWIKVDQNIISDLDAEDLRDELDDISDMLMYLQDIFNLNIPDLTIALSNSLLYYAYFPSLIGSLGCTSKKPDINSYSATIFFLTQTYDSIKEPLFINALSCGLFLQQIPIPYAKWIVNAIQPPKTYERTYAFRSEDIDLVRYVEENLSKNNIEGFINSEYPFLEQIQEEYQRLKEAKEEEEIDDTYDKSDENQREAIELVLSKLNYGELAKIKEAHLALSLSIGKPLGVWEGSKDYNYLSPTDFSEAILDSLYNDNFQSYLRKENFMTNKYSNTLLNFLRSKDDSLLLLIGGLLYKYSLSQTVDPALLFETKFYPIGNRKKSQLLHSLIDERDTEIKSTPKRSILNFEEEKTLISGSQRDKYEFESNIIRKSKGNFYDDKIMNMLLDLLRTDPPFRTTTLKLISVIACGLCYSKKGVDCLSIKQFDMLVDAFLKTIKNIKKLYSKKSLNIVFIDVFEKQWRAFKFIDHELLNKVIRSHWSLVPLYEEKYKSKLPAFLKLYENDLQELNNAIDQFLTLRYMIYYLKFKVDLTKPQNYPFEHEHRDVYDWNIGDVITEINKTLVLCNIQINNSLQMRYVVLDPEFFILIEPGFEGSNLKSIRVEIKAPLKTIDTQMDFRDKKRLHIGISELTETGEELYHPFIFHFESFHSCKSIKKTIDDNKKNQKKFLDALINSFFDQSINEVQDEDGI